MSTSAAHLDALEQQADRFYGKYRGLVVDNLDPARTGRIKAMVPEVLGEVPSGWALPCQPFTGTGAGLYAVPQPGAGVWIEFEAGDLSKPIWSGCWWADGEIPQPGAEKVRVYATSAGHKLVFDEDADEIVLEHGGGASIKLTANDITLALGGKKIVISASGVSVNDGALEVT